VSARRQLEDVLACCLSGDRGRGVARFGTELRVSMRALLARALWMQGYADQAMRAAEESIEDAQTAGHVMSLCYALALAACPITPLGG
jgi:hypothetical protein